MYHVILCNSPMACFEGLKATGKEVRSRTRRVADLAAAISPSDNRCTRSPIVVNLVRLAITRALTALTSPVAPSLGPSTRPFSAWAPSGTAIYVLSLNYRLPRSSGNRTAEFECATPRSWMTALFGSLSREDRHASLPHCTANRSSMPTSGTWGTYTSGPGLLRARCAWAVRFGGNPHEVSFMELTVFASPHAPPDGATRYSRQPLLSCRPPPPAADADMEKGRRLQQGIGRQVAAIVAGRVRVGLA